MKDLIVIGAGGHARSVIDAALLNSELSISCVLDIDFIEGVDEEIFGVPVLGGVSYLERISPDESVIFLALGDNKVRKRVSHIIENYGFESVNIVHPRASVSREAALGTGNFIGAFANIGPGVKVGNYCLLNTLSNLEHEAIIGDFCQLGPNAMVCGRSNISDNVFVGAGGIILDNISLPVGVVIGAGAVVTKNFSASNSTYIGVPARKV